MNVKWLSEIILDSDDLYKHHTCAWDVIAVDEDTGIAYLADAMECVMNYRDFAKELETYLAT